MGIRHPHLNAPAIEHLNGLHTPPQHGKQTAQGASQGENLRSKPSINTTPYNEKQAWIRTEQDTLRYVTRYGRLLELALDRVYFNQAGFNQAGFDHTGFDHPGFDRSVVDRSDVEHSEIKTASSLLDLLPKLIRHASLIRSHPLYYSLKCSRFGGVYMYTGGGGYPSLGALLDSWLTSDELVLYGEATHPFRKAYLYWGGASRLSGIYVIHAIDADTGAYLRFGYGSAFKLTTSFRTAIDTLITLGQMHPFMLKDQADVVKELCNEMELREDPS